MKKTFLICLLISVMICVSACGNEKNVENDLKSTLDAICSGSSEGLYIYGAGGITSSDIFAMDDKVQQDDINCLIRNLSKYEVVDISIKNEKAEAELIITSPDMVNIMEEVDQSENLQDVGELLTSVQKKLESKKFPEKEFHIIVTLEKINDQWYLIMNNEIANAFSGGLMEKYAEIISDMMKNGD